MASSYETENYGRLKFIFFTLLLLFKQKFIDL